MAKKMAKIENSTVINVENCHDNAPESSELININDKPVGIGDTYANGKFYRNGNEILTYIEQAKNEAYNSMLAEINASYEQGVNGI